MLHEPTMSLRRRASHVPLQAIVYAALIVCWWIYAALPGGVQFVASAGLLLGIGASVGGLLAGSRLAWWFLTAGHTSMTLIILASAAPGADALPLFGIACIGLLLLLSRPVRRYAGPGSGPVVWKRRAPAHL